ncbi:hypothetical protein PZ895_00440 [Mesorhizobium sp. YIM 152430]|uniref:hypothetical protein n=1 Tax=Mesorhizobium sp. YIM 152430 TaxID=3031761 RepID=UPI0023DC4FA5|nr:hypothetical protein [Mesorhizobium sp. YIM 152430]MDF1598244.1 hypothetical protein [Mesorhizobium sp. YIM 152430]
MSNVFNMPAALAASNAPGAFYESSEWLRKEIMKPQFHEAGHAVVARLTGFRVEWVSVDSAFIDSNPVAIENHCTGFGPVCMTISSERLNPIINRAGNACRIRTKQDKETVIGYAMHVLAGPMAEQGIDPAGFDHTVCERDFEQVAIVLQLAEPNKAARKKLMAVARRKLDRMLDEHWATIRRVAYALHERRTLFGDEIDNIMNGFDVREAA